MPRQLSTFKVSSIWQSFSDASKSARQYVRGEVQKVRFSQSILQSSSQVEIQKWHDFEMLSTEQKLCATVESIRELSEKHVIRS